MVQVQLIGSERVSLQSRVHSVNAYTYRKSDEARSSQTPASKRSRTRARTSNSLRSFKLLRLLIIPLVALLLYAGLSMFRASAEPETVRPATAVESVMTVDSGDTLWSIAQDVKPEGMKTGTAVHLIMKRNGLDASALSSGQRLILPAKLSLRGDAQ
ncbi:LysM peptidoglycan-binding domain-containing protein [Cohnella sp. JJ-181]|uniref:LysM peptidoglycan-binding domain-containing protein n=1 Tax=Cohnella rhizoplanae TaxID=2974897 RepID=UPI0022FF6470|nr:LysM peptidoglycan-binding domain-containing protein [Cohnella sp. JJ-181]CAI6081296.1 hypothetical protein COHCIP112018_03262 [Cohnella sp. JJ-181]